MRKQKFKINQKVFIKPVKKVGVIKQFAKGKIKCVYFDENKQQQFVEVTYKDLKRVRRRFTVRVKPLAEDVIIPEYHTSGSSGFDIRAYTNGETIVVKPGERVLVDTKLAFAIPKYNEMQLRPRSGIALDYGITLPNSPATIDSDYRGEVKVIIQNTGDKDFVINHQDRICQGVIVPVRQVRFRVEKELNETKRGESGFGHTGQR